MFPIADLAKVSDESYFPVAAANMPATCTASGSRRAARFS